MQAICNILNDNGFSKFSNRLNSTAKCYQTHINSIVKNQNASCKSTDSIAPGIFLQFA